LRKSLILNDLRKRGAKHPACVTAWGATTYNLHFHFTYFFHFIVINKSFEICFNIYAMCRFAVHCDYFIYIFIDTNIVTNLQDIFTHIYLFLFIKQSDKAISTIMKRNISEQIVVNPFLHSLDTSVCWQFH